MAITANLEHFRIALISVYIGYKRPQTLNELSPRALQFTIRISVDTELLFRYETHNKKRFGVIWVLFQCFPVLLISCSVCVTFFVCVSLLLELRDFHTNRILCLHSCRHKFPFTTAILNFYTFLTLSLAVETRWKKKQKSKKWIRVIA